MLSGVWCSPVFRRQQPKFSTTMSPTHFSPNEPSKEGNSTACNPAQHFHRAPIVNEGGAECCLSELCELQVFLQTCCTKCLNFVILAVLLLRPSSLALISLSLCSLSLSLSIHSLRGGQYKMEC